MDPTHIRHKAHPLMEKYRVFRQGILVLPHLESHLVEELDKLSEAHVAVSKLPVERVYVVNSLATIQMQIRATCEALEDVKRVIDKSAPAARTQMAIEDALKDSPHAKDVLVRLKIAGGVSGLMESILVFLRHRNEQYSKSIATAETYFGSSRKESMAEMALIVKGGLPSTGIGQPSAPVAFDFCFSLVCLAVLVAVVVIVLVVKEDEDGDNRGTGSGSQSGSGSDGGSGSAGSGSGSVPRDGGAPA